MNALQTIKSLQGKTEYVLLPAVVYERCKEDIQRELSVMQKDDYVPFKVEDYVDNPVALARIKADLTQLQLANAMEVSQAYISKLERQTEVSAKVLQKVEAAIQKLASTD